MDRTVLSMNYGVSFFDCTFGELLMLYMIAGPQEFEKGPEAIARCMQSCGAREQWRFDPTGPQMTLFISYARQRLLTFLMGNHAEKSAVTTRRDWVFKALAKIRRTLDRPLLLADLPRYLGVPMSRVSCLLGDQRRQALFGTISQEPQSLPKQNDPGNEASGGSSPVYEGVVFDPYAGDAGSGDDVRANAFLVTGGRGG